MGTAAETVLVRAVRVVPLHHQKAAQAAASGADRARATHPAKKGEDAHGFTLGKEQVPVP